MAKDLKRISLNVSYEETPEKEISLVGFLFYCNGRYLQQQPVQKNLLEFNLTETAAMDQRSAETRSTSNNPAARNPTDLREFRVFIVPATDKRIENVRSIEELEEYKPYEPVLQSGAEGSLTLLPIPAQITRFWPFCHCRVTGKVSKWFSVDAAWEDRPVCKARVHICDIDAIWYWIYRIPDYIIAKVPQAILNPQELIRFPIPIPDPPPFTINPSLAVSSPFTKSSGFTPSSPAQANTSIFRTLSVEEKQMAYAANLPELSLDIRQNLASGNLNRIRETIAANYATLHPWFCLWPWWWPWFYHRRELAVVYTDASGRFDAQVTYRCTGDKPDIYIWVEYLINGVWTTVYEPAIPCHTLWDYACGTNISIHITDPRVPGNCCCDCPIPGEVVWVRSVGGTSVSHIYQKHLMKAPDGQSIQYDRIGLTDAAALYDPAYLPVKSGDYIRPFGGSPTFVVGFGNDLPNAGIFYYRWSYLKIAGPDGVPVTDTYKPLLPSAGTTQKGYEFTYVDSHGDTQFGSNTAKLGPFTKGPNDNLYIIPTERPDMAPFSVPEANPQWTEPSYRNYSITFNSDDLRDASMHKGDGLYEFRMELFDANGVLLTNLPKSTFKTPEFDNSGNSENAPDILLQLASPGATTTGAFNMLMRIDNSPCQADIFTVKVNSLPAASDCCGFVAYKPGGVEAPLDISFQAAHPNNFAVFQFGVERGTCGGVAIADADGMVIDSADGYTRDSASVYDKTFTPKDLLDSCYSMGTGKAAFAETLHVAAMATDGTTRQYLKDDGRVAAFALEP